MPDANGHTYQLFVPSGYPPRIAAEARLALEPAMPRGVVGNEHAVVILSDGVGGVGQDASRTVFAPSTSFVV